MTTGDNLEKRFAYGRHQIDQDDIDAVVEVLQGEWLTQGASVELFEESLSRYFKAPYVSAVSSGTAALHLAGLALGWERDDLIITSPLTFMATANCARFCNAEVDFADVELETGLIDQASLCERLDEFRKKNKRIRALIAVDYGGHPCDWRELRKIADEYEIALLNDNCHALGAEYLNDIGYAAKYAHVVTHSYHPVKHITTGEGGAVLTQDPSIIQRVRLFRTHGLCSYEPESIYGHPKEPWRRDMVHLGFNYRLTDFQAALGVSQLKKLHKFVQERRGLANRYRDNLCRFSGLKLPTQRESARHAFHLFSVRFNFERSGIEKADFFREMKSRGIHLQVHYPPVHLHPYYRKRYAFRPGDFPNAERFYAEAFSLPIYPGLQLSEVDYVCESVIDILKIRN